MPDTFENRLKKRYWLWMTLPCFCLYAFTVLFLAPLYAQLSNNILYMDSWLMYLFEIVISLADILAFVVAFSFFIYTVYRYRMRGAAVFFLTYFGLLALRRVGSLLMEILFSHSVGADDIWSVSVYFVLDMLTAAIVIWIVAHTFKKYTRYEAERKKLLRLKGDSQSDEVLYPYTRVYDRKNPLQACALRVGILLSLSKIVSRLIFDVYLGLPTGVIQVLIMIIYYLSDILIGVVTYAAMLWTLGFLHKMAQKKLPSEEEQPTEA